MATSFDDVIDIALITIQDYKLDKLYLDDKEKFNIITSAFLLKSLPNFTNCKTSLTYDLDRKTFLNDLSPLEISILSDLWVYEWFNWHIQNVTQFENKMTPSDFKHYSESANLKEKSEYLDKMREKYNQKMLDYSLKNLDSLNW